MIRICLIPYVYRTCQEHNSMTLSHLYGLWRGLTYSRLKEKDFLCCEKKNQMNAETM